MNDNEFETPSSGKKISITGEIYDWAQALVFSLVFIVILFTFFFRIISVVGTSMVPTLHENDKIVVSNLFYQPAPGDIVVLRKDTFMSEPIVKRVIAVEGQTVDIDFISHKVSVDGITLDEPYINALTATRGDVEFPIKVPEGCIFVLGDNRNKSTDSRWSEPGMIDTRYILGKVIFRVYPFDGVGRVE